MFPKQIYVRQFGDHATKKAILIVGEGTNVADIDAADGDTIAVYECREIKKYCVYSVLGPLEPRPSRDKGQRCESPKD